MSIKLDYQKAFDLVSHDILIEKLSRMDVKVCYLKWFRSYLQNMNMYEIINGQPVPTKEFIDFFHWV